MATSESNHFCFLDRIGSVETLWHEVMNTLDIWMDPSLHLQIESPKVVEI